MTPPGVRMTTTMVSVVLLLLGILIFIIVVVHDEMEGTGCQHRHLPVSMLPKEKWYLKRQRIVVVILRDNDARKAQTSMSFNNRHQCIAAMMVGAMT